MAHAFARNQRFDALRGETILRDLFAAAHGQTMNEMREGLMAREAALRETGQDRTRALNDGLAQARQVCDAIQAGETMPFYKAYDRAAVALARDYAITETGAKEIITEAFREAEGRELYEVAKALEKEHHRPARKAGAAERKAETARTKTSDRRPAHSR